MRGASVHIGGRSARRPNAAAMQRAQRQPVTDDAAIRGRKVGTDHIGNNVKIGHGAAGKVRQDAQIGGGAHVGGASVGGATNKLRAAGWEEKQGQNEGRFRHWETLPQVQQASKRQEAARWAS